LDLINLSALALVVATNVGLIWHLRIVKCNTETHF
jgi:hypothetical protein